jgi:uncharacterized protein YlxW (UPF0749 family)
MTGLQSLLLRAAIWVGVALVAAAFGFRMGYVFDHRAFVAYQAQVNAQAAVAREQRAEQAREDQKTTQEVQNDAARKLAAANSHVATLLSQLRDAAARNLPPVPATASASGPHGAADGHGPGVADSGPAGQTGSCQDQLAADDDALIDALTAELLWREYARGTGQAK